MNAEYLRSTVPGTNSSIVPRMHKCSVSSANDTKEDSSDSKSATPDLQTTDQLAGAAVAEELKVEQQKETEAKREVEVEAVVVPAAYAQVNQEDSEPVKLDQAQLRTLIRSLPSKVREHINEDLSKNPIEQTMTSLEMAIRQWETSTIQHNILSILMLTIRKAVEQYFADNQHCTEESDTTRRVSQNPHLTKDKIREAIKKFENLLA
jgi:hypothetical protein